MTNCGNKTNLQQRQIFNICPNSISEIGLIIIGTDLSLTFADKLWVMGKKFKGLTSWYALLIYANLGFLVESHPLGTVIIDH